MYFRFVISYLHAKKADNSEFTERVEGKEHFWASPGNYLRQSTFISLARNISGLELPPSVYCDTTFNDDNQVSKAREDEITLRLRGLLRDATIESIKRMENDSMKLTDTDC
jgi:hypothetical protein